MKITYDPTSKRVVIAFRGRISVLPDAYESETQGLAAGEFHCRKLGWTTRTHTQTANNAFRSLF